MVITHFSAISTTKIRANAFCLTVRLLLKPKLTYLLSQCLGQSENGKDSTYFGFNEDVCDYISTSRDAAGLAQYVPAVWRGKSCHRN